MTKVTLPELGEGIKDAVVSFWYYAEGDSVKAGDDIVELATDKAAFNIPAPASGTITKIICREGSKVSIGGVLAEIGD